jgi:hypothetical protein
LQLPIIGAYARILEKAQGQNLPFTTLDLGNVTSGNALTCQHLYVAFSRSKGCDCICIIRAPWKSVLKLLSSHASQNLHNKSHHIERQDIGTVEVLHSLKIYSD